MEWRKSDFYRGKDVLRLHETSLIEACDEWVPAFALLELIGVEAEQVIGGKVLEEIERTKKWHKLK